MAWNYLLYIVYLFVCVQIIEVYDVKKVKLKYW